MATVSNWNPFGVALDVTATGSNVVRKSATQFTVKINASWETYYNGAKTNYGMTASSGGGTVTINSFGTYSSSGNGLFSGTYSISGNGKQTKTISVTFKNFNNDNGDAATKTVSFDVSVPAWTSYKITYDANGGTGAPASQTKWKNQTLVLSSTKPTKTGYTFKGWSLTQNGSVYYAAGGSCGKNENLTLWAVWQENALTVNYYSNYATTAFDGALNTVGADKNVVVRTQKFNYDDSYTDYGLANYSDPGGSIYMTRTGYTATGKWGTTTNGGTLVGENEPFANGQAVAERFGKSLKTGNVSLNLYAQWDIKKYNVTYNANGGENAPASQTKTHGTKLKLSEQIPTKQGYNFFGWSTSPAGNAVYTAGSEYATDANVTLYAVWELAASKVTWYDADGNAHKGQARIYDSSGNVHYAIITVYDSDGNARTVI